ncbi:adenylate kinase [Streptomyces coffeae]|uniref:Adenylate kinase n=1 Tax=Streptomyces coffeae TaxID=621382 RepID=A0ABS1ND00_9ACTN|nr:adenylate kinase [Streptomyces coffeae]MBL1097938.1 adenylate kinase [Streptomyces coffeae]
MALTGNRVWVVGPSGAGKSTVARALAEARGLPHYELDAMFWAPGWQRRPEDEFLAGIAALDRTDRWIADGQYASAHPVLEELADTVVWVDPRRSVTTARLLRRTLRRLRTREELWNGNRERPGSAVGLVLWAHREFPVVRRTNTALFTRMRARSVRCLRLRTSHDIQDLLTKERV